MNIFLYFLSYPSILYFTFSCRFIFGGTQGRLRFGPPQSFSPLVEALSCELEISECLSFGDLPKNTYCGPSTLHHNMEPFVPTPVNISSVILPHFAMDIHEKLAENLHELWAMRKIELGWTYGEVWHFDSCLFAFLRAEGSRWIRFPFYRCSHDGFFLELTLNRCLWHSLQLLHKLL